MLTPSGKAARWKLTGLIAFSLVQLLPLRVASKQLPDLQPLQSGSFTRSPVGYLGCVQSVPNEEFFAACLVAFAFEDHVRVHIQVWQGSPLLGWPLPDYRLSYTEDVTLPREALRVDRKPGYAPLVTLHGHLPRTGDVLHYVSGQLGGFGSGPKGSACDSHSVYFFLNGPEIGLLTEEMGWFGGRRVQRYQVNDCNAFFTAETDGWWMTLHWTDEHGLLGGVPHD